MSKKDLNEETSLIEEYSLGLLQNDPAYYERMMDIIDFLTYITEKKDKNGNIVKDENGNPVFVRKRLRPIDKDLYRIIMRAAGKGVCFKSGETLAWELNVSEASISKAKRNLAQSFEQLNGQSLINIEERLVANKDKEDNPKNKNIHHFITTNYLWNFNNAFMRMLKKQKDKKEWHQSIYPVGEMNYEEAIQAIEDLRQLSILEKTEPEIGVEKDPNLHSKVGGEAGLHTKMAPQRPTLHSEANHTNHNQTYYDTSYPHSRECDMTLKKNDIYDLMNKIGIYKGLQKKLLKKYGWEWISKKLFEFKFLDRSKMRNPGSYFVKMVTSFS